MLHGKNVGQLENNMCKRWVQMKWECWDGYAVIQEKIEQKNEVILRKVKITLVEDKLREWRLDGLDMYNIGKRGAPEWMIDLIHVGGKRGRGRLKFA